MPYPAMHLLIANRMLASGFSVRDDSAFYLGSLGPDAVHFRAGFKKPEKARIHLYPSADWGDSRDYAGWHANAIAFLQAHSCSASHDFCLGYAAHVLTDLACTRVLYIPTLERLPDAVRSGQYHAEVERMDKKLWFEHPERERIFHVLASANPSLNISLVSNDELLAIRDHVTLCQYASVPTDATWAPELIPEDGYRQYIVSTATDLAAALRPHT